MSIQNIITMLPALMISVIFHEIAHGYAAHKMGDDTAKNAGRLTINPIPHIDLFGTIILPMLFLALGSNVIFGWAKPVPINPNNFKDLKKGMLIVSSAGFLTNFFIAIMGGLVLRAIYLPPFYNAIPVFVQNSIIDPISVFLTQLVFINLILGFFNMIPIPPLDGSRVLMSFFSLKYWQKFYEFEIYGFFLITLLLFTGILGKIIFPIIYISYRLILGT